ncbi:MAG: hypothetical protein WCE30_03415 [Mycobacterium sp.]
MKTATGTRRIYVFNFPAPELVAEDSEQYYRECQLAGAPSVEVELADRDRVVISATRYLPPDVTVGAEVTDGALQVICTRHGGEPIVMREFDDWIRYSVSRGDRE